MELYQQLTSSLNQLFTTQLTEAVQWRNVPGMLTRISASPSGFTWGVNETGGLFRCQEPCTGDWKDVPVPGDKILDLTTDAQSVYVLIYNGGEPEIKVLGVNGSGDWRTIKAPRGATTIASTSEFLWADTAIGPFKCGLPCTTGNWVGGTPGTVTLTGIKNGSPQNLAGPFAPSTGKVKLSSASAKRAYGISPDLQGMVYENGAWKPIAGFQGKQVTSVAGEMDDTAIYAVTTQGELLRCGAPCSDARDVQTLNTRGHGPVTSLPKQVTVNPQSRQVWQISTAPAEQGNLFAKVDGNLQNVLDLAQPLDAQRDQAIRDWSASYDQSANLAEAGLKIDATREYVQKLRPRVSPEEDDRVARRQLATMDLQTSLRLIQVAVGTVFLCLLVYLVLPVEISHGVAFVIVCTGILVAVSFSTVRR